MYQILTTEPEDPKVQKAINALTSGKSRGVPPASDGLELIIPGIEPATNTANVIVAFGRSDERGLSGTTNWKNYLDQFLLKGIVPHPETVYVVFCGRIHQSTPFAESFHDSIRRYYNEKNHYNVQIWYNSTTPEIPSLYADWNPVR